MKSRLTLLLACLFCCMASYGQTADTQSEEKKDSTVNIIGYFCKNDTLTYWINESEWKVVEGDTTRTSSVSTKVMLAVTDSTKNGYTMEYKFLEFESDSTSAAISKLTGDLIKKLGDKIKGTVIKFHTDDMGHITKYDNLREIKRQAKQLYSEAFYEMPLLDSLKTMGVDTKAMMKMVDTDQLVSGYTEELELLFKWHGSAFPIGENKMHDDATADSYATDTYVSMSADKEIGEYTFSYDIDQYIPAEDVKEFIGAIVEAYSGEEMADSVMQEFDKYANEPLTYTTSYTAHYFWNGWPKRVISQTNSVYPSLKSGKLKQTYIEWDTAAMGNY